MKWYNATIIPISSLQKEIEQSYDIEIDICQTMWPDTREFDVARPVCFADYVVERNEELIKSYPNDVYKDRTYIYNILREYFPAGPQTVFIDLSH